MGGILSTRSALWQNEAEIGRGLVDHALQLILLSRFVDQCLFPVRHRAVAWRFPIPSPNSIAQRPLWTSERHCAISLRKPVSNQAISLVVT